jgi:hypothetical protein
MSGNGIFADGYGVRIVRISRRYVADIHFGPCRECARYMECRDSDTTMNEEKCFSIGNHNFVLMMSSK